MISNPKVVLVTGAEGVLGKIVAERALSAGYLVVATFLHDPLVEWKSKDRLVPLQMDVTDEKSIERALRSVSPSLPEGGIPCWIQCAGGFRFAAIDQFTNQDLEFLVNLNFKSAFFLARALLPSMKERDFGRIVLVSAKATLQPGAGMGPYAASKAALNMLTLCLVEEVKAFDINVNAVLPSIIDTPANRKDMPQADFSAWVDPIALADLMLRLIHPSPPQNPIHGALIPVAGRV